MCSLRTPALNHAGTAAGRMRIPSRVTAVSRSQTIDCQLENVELLLQGHGCQRVFLVVDEVAYVQSGAQQRLSALLNHYAVRTFAEFTPNPTLKQASVAAAQLSQEANEVVLAIGGGTAIDVAKLACCLVANQQDAAEGWSDLLAGQPPVQPRKHPLLAVPTTAGTGSEATHFAVLYAGNQKHSIAHPSLLPDAVVLDATLTKSLPRAVAVASGLDALAQAIESLWSNRSTNASMADAETALA